MLYQLFKLKQFTVNHLVFHSLASFPNLSHVDPLIPLLIILSCPYLHLYEFSNLLILQTPIINY